MRGYAHPIGEKDEATGKYPEGWCNEEDLEKVRNLPAQSPDKVLPEHQKVINDAKREVINPKYDIKEENQPRAGFSQVEKPAPKKEPPSTLGPAPQELGMWWKEAGELYRMWEMHPEIRPDKPWAKTFVAAYFAQMFSVLPISSSKNKEE